MSRWIVRLLGAASLTFATVSSAARPATTGFVPVPGGSLFYEERGTGPAVILLHGGMLDHRMWDPQMDGLARSFRVIRYDVAGHGRSKAPEGPWRDYEHLGLLMDALKVESASLVGLSLGGRVAIDFAIAHPERVRALALFDPGLSGFPFTGRDWAGRIAERGRARRAGDAGKVADLFLRSWLAGPHRTPAQVEPAVWAKAREMALPNALTVAQGSELEPPAVGRLGEVKAPVLLVEGELDCEDIHLIARLVERRVPGTRRVVVPGVAHMPTMERPAEVNRLLLEFLGKPPSPPPSRPPLPSRSQVVEVDGGRLWVERAGEGDPVVLIHDGIVHAAGWDDVLPSLSSQYEVIRYDRRGYGRSTAPSAPYSNLEDLEALLRHLGLARVHLVGSSSGGGLAIDYALAHPEGVASLTLVGAVVSGFPYTRHMANRGGHLTAAATTDPAEERRYWSLVDPYFVAPASKAAHERVAALLEAFPQNLGRERERFARRPPPALPRLGSIRVPALVLAGEHDIPDVHAHAGAIAAGIPNARRDVVADSGHVPYLEQPEELATRVVAFLQGAPFLAVLDRDGVARATALFRAARAKDRSAVLFDEDELNRRGYERLAGGATEEAVALFRLNAEAFPASPNTHDSLAEALLAAGDRAGAVAEYRKALEVDPSFESAQKALERLEAPADAQPSKR
ncbi:MAG: alpha/beta fold hydrolase [Acidobacteria bacterium]|nr:MAG: alpha/beta fold hydrolase [Acidobacteriota bacterium]MCE7959413.1 alpha/beta fold hydrolase [Acidobacteria bacterium ACB2]